MQGNLAPLMAEAGDVQASRRVAPLGQTTRSRAITLRLAHWGRSRCPLPLFAGPGLPGTGGPCFIPSVLSVTRRAAPLPKGTARTSSRIWLHQLRDTLFCCDCAHPDLLCAAKNGDES